MAYLDYTRNQESPEIFHFWTGVSVLSAALGRNVWIDKRFYKIYPNHYIILLAGSAECRKSVAVGIGKELLERAKIVPISAERITNADVLKQLGELSQETGKAELFIFADELATFLSTEETHKGIITTLTRLFTCPEHYENRTKTAGVDVLENCCINILAATTPTDFGNIIPGAATGSGFVPRLHIVHQDHARERVPWPSRDEELGNALVLDLQHVREVMKGEFVLDPVAKEWWDTWYSVAFKYPDDMQLNGFYGRKPDYVLKLGMVIAASESDELVVYQPHLETALGFLNQMEQTMWKAYELVGATPSLKYADLILSQLKKSGGRLTRSQVLHKNWNKLDAETLSEVMRYLEESDMVKSLPSASGKGTVYVLVGEVE